MWIVHIRQKCVNEYIEDRIVKLFFVKSADHGSDILTKNLSAKLHKKHSKMVVEKL